MGNELQVMGLNIAICDDEKVIREQIKELAEEILKLREVSLCVVGNREHIDLNGIRKLFNRWGNMGQNVEGGTE